MDTNDLQQELNIWGQSKNYGVIFALTPNIINSL